MRPRRPDYDAPEFREALAGPEPLKVLAQRYGVSVGALYQAAERRGLTPRRALWDQHAMTGGRDG